MIPALVPALPYVVPTKMIDVINHLGLETSLVLGLDAGDAASYDGSSQTWSDVSGSSNHYYRGSGSGSDGADPAFSGVAGRESSAEYFSSDGGDLFTPTASHTFANNWHKDGAQFTIGGWIFVPSGVASPPGYPILSTRGAGQPSNVGVGIQLSGLASTGRFSVNYNNGSTTQSIVPATNDLIVENTWLFVMGSINEGSGASFAFYNGTVDAISSDSYSSPSASSPTEAPRLWRTESTTPVVAPNGGRLSNLVAWNRPLSQSEVSGLYSATKAKYGL